MDEVPVVTCFLRHRGEVLLFRRTDDAETYPGRWGAVTGYVEADDPLGTARIEIGAETRLADVEPVCVGEPFVVRDENLGRSWRVHPFLVDAPSRDVRTNEETALAEWTTPTAILRRETVPALWRSYEAVAPTPETIGNDAEHGSAYLSVRALEAVRDVAGRVEAEGDDVAEVFDRARALVDARPSMAALVNRVNRVVAGSDTPVALEAAAIEGIERAFEADVDAAHRAADVVDGETVLTLSRSGTVLAALRRGARAVVVAESRPAREGVGVAEALARDDIEVTLCTDAAVAHLLAARDPADDVGTDGDGDASSTAVDAVLVGADAVLPDGRVVNKTGTRTAALAAAHENVPFYVAAASDKVRGEDERHLEAGDPTTFYDGAAAISVENPTFDVTPADLVDGVITERGILDAGRIAAVAEEHRGRAAWRSDTSA